MKHPEYEEFGFEWVDEMYPEEENKMMSECEKRGCGYYWQAEGESRPRCHYDDPMFPAPCEYDTMETADDPEDWEEPDFADDEMGFDPYEGYYTWDC